MTDRLGREITYLRISVTDKCNLRCRYCMPEDGVCKKSHFDMLTEDEIVTATEAAAALGIRKVRITGGEPLVKKNILSICRRVAAVKGIEEVCLTTNGILLQSLAKPLKEAGVKRLNLSLDTLDPEKYAYMTRLGRLEDFYRGLEAALAAGFEKIKINTVLIGGFNDQQVTDLAALTKQYPVDVRFIEMMPMAQGEFDPAAFISNDTVLEQLPEAVAAPADGGVAKRYRLPGALGSIGLISPISDHFCASCNRIRLTADGKLKPCLHGAEEFSVKGLSFEQMKAVFEEAIWNKPAWHGDLDATHRSRAGRNMNQIGG